MSTEVIRQADGVVERLVDGVPTFSVAERGEHYVGALVFRVGFVDEPLFARGITHLLEHLALTDPLLRHDDPDLHWNGQVQAHTTTFYAQGEPEQVGAFLRGVARRLRGLPTDRLVAERRVLRAEAARRGASVVGQHLSLRYGTTGIGAVDDEEWGLRWLESSDVAQWSLRHCTAANAAAWFTGPVPDGLRFDLPEGERRPIPAATPLPDPLPAYATGAPNRVTVSFLGPRVYDFSLTLALVAEVVRDRLRDRDASTYHIDTIYEYVDTDTAMGLIVADCLDEDAAAVRDAISVELSRLRLDGPDEDHVERLKHAIRSEDDPDEIARRSVPGAALARVTGRAVTTSAEDRAEVAAITPSTVRAQVASMIPTALWTVPDGVWVSDQRIQPVRNWSDLVLTGTAFRRGAGCPPEIAGHELVVGDEGVMLRVDDDRRVTLRYQDLTVAVSYADRSWLLVGRDGFRFTVQARQWFDGAEVIRRLDEGLPQAIRVRLDEALDPKSPDLDPQAPATPAVHGPSEPGREATSPAARRAGAVPTGPRSPVSVRLLAASAVWIVAIAVVVAMVTGTGRVQGSLITLVVGCAAAATRYVWNATG